MPLSDSTLDWAEHWADPLCFCVLNDNHLFPKAIEIFSYYHKGNTLTGGMTSRCYMSQESVATEVRPVYLFLRDGVKRRFLFNTGCSDFVYLKKKMWIIHLKEYYMSLELNKYKEYSCMAITNWTYYQTLSSPPHTSTQVHPSSSPPLGMLTCFSLYKKYELFEW